jgi:ribosome-binding protein aMBF1 (putative translation factor)
MNNKQLAIHLHNLIRSDINLKGLSIRSLPSSYPIKMRSIYRMQKGKMTDQTKQKVEEYLQIKIKTRHEIL